MSSNLEANSNELFSIENSSNRELGKQIRKDIDNLAQNFIDLDDQENKILISKKAIILEMADKFERLREIGEYPFPITSICSDLYRYLQRKGYSINRDYVYTVIKQNAPQYINNSYDSVGKRQIDIKIYQDEVMDAVSKLKNARLDLLSRNQVQELLSVEYENIDSHQDYADANNIIAEPIGTTGEPQYDSKELDPFKDPVITDKLDPRESAMYNAGMRLGNAILGFGHCIIANTKMMKDYPPSPEDKEAEEFAPKRMNEWAEWWENLTTSMKGGTDRKYRRSIFQWVKIADDENDWGKHAASSKNPYTARFRDPKTGEWKEEIRKLTREQIGDKSPKVREFTRIFKQLVPACIDFIRWSETYLHPYTNGESVKLGPKLSDRSIR